MAMIIRTCLLHDKVCSMIQLTSTLFISFASKSSHQACLSPLGSGTPTGDYYAAAYHGYYSAPNAYAAAASAPYGQIGSQGATPAVVSSNQTILSKYCLVHFLPHL